MTDPVDIENRVLAPQDLFQHLRPLPGGGDLWCVGPGAWERLGEIAAILAGAQVDDLYLYHQVFIVAPPDSPPDDQILAGVTNSICAHNRALDPEAVAEFVANRIVVRRSASLHVDDFLASLPSSETVPIAIAVPDAGRYRSGVPSETFERTWCKDLAYIAGLACDRAKKNDGYILFDAGISPDEPESRALLMESHADCGFICAEAIVENRGALREQLSRIKAIAAEGGIGEALNMADSLPLAEGSRLYVKAEVFLNAGVPLHALQLLQTIRKVGEFYSAAALLPFARIALAAGHSPLAEEFLREALPRASTLEEFEGVLEIGDEMDDPALVADALAKLEVLFPSSPVLLAHRVNYARVKGDLHGAAALLDQVGDRGSEAALFRELARQFDLANPDYDAVLARIAETSPEFLPQARLSCIRHAQASDRWLDAAAIALKADGQPSSAADTHSVISTVQSLLLNDRTDPPVGAVSALYAAVEFVADRLAAVPSDAESRMRLSNLLSIERSGLMGHFVLRQILVSLSAQQPRVSEVRPERQYSTEQDLKDFDLAARKWMASARTIVLGASRCSADLVPLGFHSGTMWRIIWEFEDFLGSINEPEDEEWFLQFVGIAVGFAPHLSGADRDLDIKGLEVAASCLARANRRQKARDVIEMVLRMAGDDPARARAAWFAYAEVHRLAGDPREAALAAIVGLCCEAVITPDAAYYESLTLIRLLRDLDEHKAARALIAPAGELLKQIGLHEEYGSRLEIMKLQIDQHDVLRRSSVDLGTLETLVADALAAAHLVLGTEDDPGPMAALLSQTLRLARLRGAKVSPDADDILRKLMTRLPIEAAGRIERLSNAPTIDDLSDAVAEVEEARYGHNIIKDIREVVMLARRYLLNDTLDPAGAALAIELLADHGLMSRDEFGFEMPSDLPKSPGEVLETAKAISRTGLSVGLLGLDEVGRLIRLDIVNGGVGIPVREEPNVFSFGRLHEWRQRFPYDYAFLSERDEHGRVPDAFTLSRAFENSTRGLGVSGLPSSRTVIIPDADLADIPVNLLSVDGIFAGEERVMAVAPSLHWLSKAAGRRGEQFGPSHAWIPTENAPADSALVRVAGDVAPILDAAGIPLSAGSLPPPALQGAELAIVAAHGGLAKLEGRYFRGVADEAKGVMSGVQLAHELAGAKVAILFVCNAARLDIDHEAQASFGLARMLLDRGCCAVIGSPWPLGADVPGRWLSSFLEAWNLDFPVADANSFANEKVGGRPDARHALHVYGDPLARRYRP